MAMFECRTGGNISGLESGHKRKSINQGLVQILGLE